MAGINPYDVVRRLQQNPKKMIDDARKGDRKALVELANFWDQGGKPMLSKGVLDAFFAHLEANVVPSDPSRARVQTPANDNAFMALVGISKTANILSPDGTWEDPGDSVVVDKWGPILTRAWPGIFAWSQFFFVGRCQAAPGPTIREENQKQNMDIIAAVWYALTRSVSCRKAMRMTPGAVELATQMWIIQDKWQVSQEIIDIPTPSAALDALLRNMPTPEEITPEVGNKYPIDRVVAAGGKSPENITKLMMSRLRTALNKPRMEPVSHVAIYLDLMGHLSRSSTGPLRFAFLNANTIGTVAKIAVGTVTLLNEGGERGLLDIYSACFAYFYNMLETSEGFTWISQGINAGLLTAFVDGSPWFTQLIPDDRGIVFDLIGQIISKYLVYRSVVLSADVAIQKLSTSPHKERVERSSAAQVWKDFCNLVDRRKFVAEEAKVVRKKSVTCDNVHCQKVDEKNAFRKCSGCQSTFYCSKECQTIAWKESHKTMCKLKQAERLDGVSQAISKLDAQYFHHLFPREARELVDYLRQVAREKYPGVSISDLMIQADYTQIPQVYTMIPIADFEKHQPKEGESSEKSVSTMARNELMVERARQNPGKFVLIQSKIVYGQGLQLVTTVVSGAFWNAERVDPKEYILEAFIEEIE